MEKKTTVKDVAKAAGVSVATVSYIMNNRTDQKISDATKKKVLQIANLLNYVPSSAAKSLATGHTNIIGVSYRLSDSTPSRNLEITGFVNLLIERLNRLKYDVLFLPIRASLDNIPINRNIDGIIAIDLSEKEFRELSDNYMVPIISIDMIIHDELFYQVYSDYSQALQKALALTGDNTFVILEPFGNENFQAFVTSSISPDKLLFFPDDYKTLKDTIKEQKVIVLGATLGLMLKPFFHSSQLTIIASTTANNLILESSQVIEIDTLKKANMAINLLLNALERKFEVKHEYIIS